MIGIWVCAIQALVQDLAGRTAGVRCQWVQGCGSTAQPEVLVLQAKTFARVPVKGSPGRGTDGVFVSAHHESLVPHRSLYPLRPACMMCMCHACSRCCGSDCAWGCVFEGSGGHGLRANRDPMHQDPDRGLARDTGRSRCVGHPG